MIEVVRGRPNGAGPQRVRTRKESSWTAEKRDAFLAELSETANVTGACKAVGMSVRGMHCLRKRDAAFRQRYEAALSDAYAKLELVLLNRAMQGEQKPVRYRGKVVDRMTVYSNALGIRLLQAHEQRVERAREAAALESIEAIRTRVEHKLSLLNKRLGGDG